MPSIPRAMLAVVSSRVATLRYPCLTALAACLLLLDLVIPDFIPLADEILLAIVTAALASWKSERRRAPAPAPADPLATALQQ